MSKYTARCPCGLSLTYWVRGGELGQPVRLETPEGAEEGPYGDHNDEHPGLCCDCFDESFGMPPENRTWPRP